MSMKLKLWSAALPAKQAQMKGCTSDLGLKRVQILPASHKQPQHLLPTVVEERRISLLIVAFSPSCELRMLEHAKT